MRKVAHYCARVIDGDQLARPGAWLAAVAVALVLAITTVGLPGTLIILGTWALAGAVLCWAPASGGSASWAAGVVLEVALLGGLSGLVAEMSPNPHGSLVNLAILATPALLGLAAIAVARLHGLGSGARGSARPELALSVLVLGLGVARWIASTGSLHDVAWAMSGDGRNHVILLRELLSSGGLTVAQLRGYPGLIDSVTALISGAGHRGGLAPGDLALHDARAVASTYVLAGVALGCLFIAALLEVLPPALAKLRVLPPSVVVVLLAAASTVVSSLVLGLALHDGFVSAYGALGLAAAATVLALRCCRTPAPFAYLLLGPATALVAISWTPLAAVPGALTMLATVLVVLRAKVFRGAMQPSAWLWWLSAVISVGALLAVSIAVYSQHGRLITQFKAHGATFRPPVRILYLLALVAVGCLLTARTRAGRIQLLVPVVATAGAGVTIKWMTSLADSHTTTWTYYSSKALWLFSSCLIWLIFVPLLSAGLHIVHTDNADDSRTARRSWTAIAIARAVAWSVALLVVIGFGMPGGDPVPIAARGWRNPDADVVRQVVASGNLNRPFVLWKWSVRPNDRIGNFWAVLMWAAPAKLSDFPLGVPGGPINWAYLQTGRSSDLCALGARQPHLLVVTRDAGLGAELRAACPNSSLDVVLAP